MIEKRMNKDFFLDNENIRASFFGMHKKMSMHTHEFWEMSYVYEGNGTNYTENGSETVQDGELLIIAPGAAHSLVSSPDSKNAAVRVCNCLFTQKYYKSLMKRYSQLAQLSEYALYGILRRNKPFYLSVTDDNAHNIRHLMWLIAHEYNHYTSGSDIIIDDAMLTLFIIITRLYEYQEKKITPTVSRNSEVDELMKYMRTNFSSQLTLEHLAGRVHLSREYLCRYFKQYTGKTISQFLTEIRITRAKQMLKDSSVPISDIAVYCGYPSISNFQKAFKKYTGVSPSAYRKG